MTTTRAGTDAEWPSIRSGGDWTAEYHRSKRLLFGALSRLAATGYPVPPTEGLDLIHDFFIEAWDGLARRYEPERGRRDTYIFASFVRFARPRIGRLRRLRATLVSPAEIGAMLEGQPDPREADGGDLAAVRRVLDAQPPDRRDLLVAYLDGERPSERELARRFDITRYELRLRLADALGRTAVALGKASGFPDPDRAIALALWRDNRSPKEAAAFLEIPIPEINAARQRAFRRLVLASRGSHDMSPRNTDIGTLGLLQAALRPDARPSDIEALREHREAIWNVLDEPGQQHDIFEGLQPDPARLALVYEALGDGGSTAWQGTTSDPFAEARDGDDRRVGQALVEALLPNLPERLTDFHAIFAGTPSPEAGVLDMLLADPSVIGAGETGRVLAGFGVTPIAIAEASHALANLAMRLCRTSDTAIGDTLVWLTDASDSPRRSGSLTRERAVREVELATESAPSIAARLCDWLAEAVAYTPKLLDGFDAVREGSMVVLKRTDVRTSDLMQRWTAPDQPAKVAGFRPSVAMAG